MNSTSITKLAPALVAAQGQIKHAVKDSSNPHFRSKYADLGSVWEAVEDALKANGLAVIQMPCEIGGNPGLCTTILHTSGEYVSESVPLILTKPGGHPPDSQAVGSAISYMRRYALAAALGVRTCDDDAEATMVRRDAPTPTVCRETARPAPRPPVSAGQQLGEDLGLAPADFQDEGAGSSDWPVITVETVTEKNGEGAKGPWIKYGVKGSDGKWYGTFDTKIGEMAKGLKGREARISFRQNAKNAAFNDLLEIRPA